MNAEIAQQAKIRLPTFLKERDWVHIPDRAAAYNPEDRTVGRGVWGSPSADRGFTVPSCWQGQGEYE
jgi:hypothetical protein